MPKKTSQVRAKKPLTRASARRAVEAAKKFYSSKRAVRPASWKEGGREWSRVLGHFGSGKKS